mgnify:CR=1 FL=1
MALQRQHDRLFHGKLLSYLYGRRSSLSQPAKVRGGL